MSRPPTPAGPGAFFPAWPPRRGVDGWDKPGHDCAGRLCAFLAALLLVSAALAQDAPPRDWSAEKCRRYREASDEALRRFGRDGLGADFLARHAAFLAGGCRGPADVCPRTPQELALANILVIRAMNAGMASTFPPFACRDR